MTPGADPRPRGPDGGSLRAGRPHAPLVEIRLRGAFGPHWLQRVTADWGATAKLHVCRPLGTDPDRVIRLVQLTAPPARMPEIVRFLRKEVRDEVVTLTRTGSDRLLVWTNGPTPELCRSVFEVGGVCTTCPYLPGDDEAPEVLGVLVPSPPSPGDTLAGGRPGTELLRIGRYRGPSQLTTRQARALRVAFRLGYFAHPRRSDLGDVAKALELSRSATMELLRRAVWKLADDHLQHAVPVTGLA